MKTFLSAIAALLFLTLLFISPAAAKTSLAFGYLTNKSSDVNYNYLETIFPNSFASSLMNIFDINVIKPHAVNEILAKHNLSLKKEYEPHEINELMGKIKSDIFIYGDFMPLPNNRLKIVLSFYTGGSNRLFTFTNIGKMETEIFKLVDRITQVIMNFMDKSRIYKAREIQPGAKMAILSNLNSHELNMIYIPFMDKGYIITCIQGNSINNSVMENTIDSLQFIYTRDNSYGLISDKNNILFKTGTWASEKYMEKLSRKKEIYKKYDTEYDVIKDDLLLKMKNAYNNNIDYLLIIGFNNSKDKAWVRCIDINSKDLIWMQENIDGKNVADVSYKIIEEMSSPVPLKTIKKDKNKK